MWKAENIDEGFGVVEKINANRPVAEQPVYNMLERDKVEGALTEAVNRRGMGLVVFSPLAQGILTGKYNDGIPADSRANDPENPWFKDFMTEARLRGARGITALARDMGVTPAALAVAWTLKHPNVSSAIMGATKTAQVDENLKSLDVKITPEIDAKIEAILQNKPVAANAGSAEQG
jgi:aryl-alcohol dehydrogenase-like predicted oxidoreductase